MPLREVISAAEIARRVSEIGAEVEARLPPGPLTVVGVLRGAFVFTADLVRAIHRDLTVDFLGVRSYGDATVSSGVVEITTDLGAPIAGRHVLLVEDIVDTGLTLRYLLDLLKARGPASLHVCALLAKPINQSGTLGGFPNPPATTPLGEAQLRQRDPDASLPLDFVGFKAPDGFVVGYGLDARQLYRNLPGICILEE
ncbi:MAG TPA: phosphoribosyltransferase family protein [Polyangia bacterium]|nr:phosphoribosyltransferase family protein [Polyangia bacterium]